MSIIENNQHHFLSAYSNYPNGRYISIFLLRKIESEAIFRTEGSGEPLSREFVHAGTQAGDEIIQRVVISKRKQTAVERRTGRELLRKNDLLFTDPKQKAKPASPCALNRNNPCGKCMDCMIYGYAAGGGGAQKSRVITDDAFSLHPAHIIIGTKQFNALYDNSTMRDPESGEPSTSIGTDEYVKPEAVFLDIETIKDVTPAEFQYILGNILRSTRYGAISSRIGKVKNHVVGIIFSDCEMVSNLEWTQATYDALRGDADTPDFPLHLETVQQAAIETLATLSNDVMGQATLLSQEDVAALLAEMKSLYGDETAVINLLKTATNAYPSK
ncbi:CRISPR-associated protein Csc2 [hydrothermal vent metagenome]|uniref:CRISPR-associated protein Csc2 n=1 Tax=hydrothermal vent metagenome TaxID=652676 RepID=A0A3B0V1D1_9ZZZZ